MRPAQKVLVTLANRQQRAAVRNFNGQMGVAGVNALAHGAARSLDELNPLMRVLAQSLATNALPKRELRETNQKIAENARAAMARYYATMLPERSSHYRPQDRLVGALGRALRDPSMTERTTDRVISFINPRMMDDTAKHWARVNYGVAGALTQGPSREAATFTVSVGGQKLMTLRDPNKPRPGGVYLPERFR